MPTSDVAHDNDLCAVCHLDADLLEMFCVDDLLGLILRPTPHSSALCHGVC
jgi:hypothetical protein